MLTRARRFSARVALVCLSLVLLLSQTDRVSAVGRDQLALCRDAAFSTEQGFMMRESRPSDGNPWISDGDLLSPNGVVCARNADLTRVFSPTGAPIPDVGLDAVDVIDADPEIYLVAFSTEIDHPTGTFVSGDLLVTNGVIIPNIALVHGFFSAVSQTPYDVGLDEVKFIGKDADIRRFLEAARELTRDGFIRNPGALRELLARYEVDIWFSVEEYAATPNFAVIFLDGDILSARSASRVIRQDTLLAPPVPAGIPTRGVDFGADAFAVDRNGSRPSLLFSTEIGFTSEVSPTLTWTDGDVLRLAGIVGPTNDVVFKNYDLIKNFNPAARDLGLDALFFGPRVDETQPNIQQLCGDFPVAEFDGGAVAIGGPGTGLYHAPPASPPRRPCGAYVPIDGYLPPTGVIRFRVAFRKAGDPVPPVGQPGIGIRTEWHLYNRQDFWPNLCWAPNPPHPEALVLATDADGWMNAPAYLEAKTGGPSTDFCANSGMRLAVWDTNDMLGRGWAPPDRNGHYVVWLEWEDAGGLHREPVEHHVQLDNRLPTRAPGSNDPIRLEVRLMDGVTPVPACGQAPTDATEIQVWGQFDDPHYLNFQLRVLGGNPPVNVSAGTHQYYDLTDGPPGLKNTNATGTTPDATTVHLRNINLATLLGESFKRCCYVLELYVRDAAIRHSFNFRTANDNSGSYYSYQLTSFEAGP